MDIDNGGVTTQGELDWLRESGYGTILPALTTLVPGKEPIAVLVAQKLLMQTRWQQQERNPAITNELCGSVLRGLLQEFIVSQFPPSCIWGVLMSVGVHEREARLIQGNMLLAVNMALPRSIVVSTEVAATMAEDLT